MKKLICLLLCIISLCSAAFAADSYRCESFLDEMVLCGFIQGTEKGMELDAPLTRAQAAVFCTRVIGGVYDAKEQNNRHPFTDIPDWAAAEIAYLHKNGLVNGATDTLYEADETLTAQQFYAMLLRCLGYSEKSGDFSYADTLSFARSIGLLSEEEFKAATSQFDRDGAVVAMYNALRTPVKGSRTPLCSVVSRKLNASYTEELANVILGRNKVFNVLQHAKETMDELPGYTMTQTGYYHSASTDSKAYTSEEYQCTVWSDLSAATTVYQTVLKTTTDHGTSLLKESLYATPIMALLHKDNNGVESVETILDVGKEFAYSYAAVHTLFEPDLCYVTNFDCTETDNSYVLNGFQFRYDLLYDITSEEYTDYYYDMEIVVDKASGQLRSASIKYNDEWKTNDGEQFNVDYRVSFTFSAFDPDALSKAAKRTINLAGLTA